MTTTTEPSTRTYSLALKGEQHTFNVAAWNALDFDQLVRILSDLTGYREDYLRKMEFDRLGYASVKPSALSYGDVPTFLIRSSDGGKP